MPGGPQITRKQEAALAALVTEATLEGAAARAGISTRTLQRWLKDPDFRAAYLDARRQLVDEAVALMQRASRSAVATLLKNLKCGKPAAEVRAAYILLDLATRGVELADLAARVDAMLQADAAAKADKGDP